MAYVPNALDPTQPTEDKTVESAALEFRTIKVEVAKIDTVYGGMAAVTTVANDLNEPVSEIETVATSIANVNTVGGAIANVNTVAGAIANVNATAANIANVNAVGADLLEPVSEINTVATSIAAVDTVGANIADVTTVAGISANVTTVAGVAANVTTVAGIAANVTAVAGNATNINTVASNNANVTAVGGSISSVNTVAGNVANVNTVAANNTNVTAVGANIASVNSAAANMAAIIDAPAQASAAAASAAAAALALDNFDDRYLGSKATAPTLDNDGNALIAGALYFNNGTIVADDKGMYVYDGSQWIAASAASQAILTEYKFVATAGQTVFTGADANALTLAYTPGSIIVMLNGSKLLPQDYTATSGTSITLAVAASLNDELNIIAFATFDVANTYTQAQVDAFAVKLTGDQTVAGVKTFSSQPVMSAGVSLGSNGQIKFPATQSASSDANTLDDYEEGTWTPSIWSSGTTPTVSSYELRTGTYTKVGNLVTVNCAIRATISNAGTGVPTINGLPFLAKTGFGLGSAAVGLRNLLSGTPQAYLAEGSINVFMDTATWVTAANNYICFSISYYTT